MTAVTTTMSVQTRGGDLLDALAPLRPVLSTAKHAPAPLRSVLLSVEIDGTTSLSCSTGEVSMQVSLPSSQTSTAAGQAWIDHTALRKAATALAARRGAGAQVDLSLTVTADGARLSDGTRVMYIDVLDDVHLPSTMAPAAVTWVSDRAELAERVAAVASAAATPDCNVPIITAMRLATDGVVATDKYRLTKAPLPGTGDLEPAQPPAHVFAKVIKTLTGDTVSLGVDADRLTISTDTVTATLRGVQGDYPRGVTSIGEFDDATTVRVDRTGLLDLIKPHQNVRAAKVTLATIGQTIDVTVDDGGRALVTAQVPACTPPEKIEPVTLNAAYFADALRAVGGAEVSIHVQSTLRPVKVAGDGDITAVVQPIRVAK